MNINNYLLNKNESDMEQIRSYLYKNYIKTVIEKVETDVTDDFRMIFIGNRFKSDFNNPITFECNGAVVKYNAINKKWTTLVVPLELFNSQKLLKSEMNKFIMSDSYKLYKVYDGTIVNLYYYGDSWRISTNKAYDASNLTFIDNKTYNDVLQELFLLYPDFNMDNLDVNKCYTICFKYDKYHTFIENNFVNQNKLILMQSVDMKLFNEENKLVINEDEDIGIPLLEKYNISDYQNINNLSQLLNNEITRYKRDHNSDHYFPIFGYILRSNNYNKTKNYSNILLESNLMSKIRNLIYNHSFAKKLHFYNILDNNDEVVIDKNYYNMSNLVSLKMFLVKKDLNLFLSLFPQYKTNMESYNAFLKVLTKYIIKNYNLLIKNQFNINKIIKNEIKIDLLPIQTDMNINYDKMNKLAILIFIDLKNKKINLNVNENYDILYDYLNNLVYLDYYYSYLNN